MFCSIRIRFVLDKIIIIINNRKIDKLYLVFEQNKNKNNNLKFETKIDQFRIKTFSLTI